MTTLSFENLDFSILIEVDNKVAYLQEWDDGNWSEPHRFSLPQPPEALQGASKLAQAVKSFRGDTKIEPLRDALTHGAWKLAVQEASGWFTRFWAALQASCRGLATFYVKETT